MHKVLIEEVVKQQRQAANMMWEVQRRALEQGINMWSIRDTLQYDIEDAEAIDKIFEEVNDDFTRNKALVIKS